jgi:hypothetical protein
MEPSSKIVTGQTAKGYIYLTGIKTMTEEDVLKFLEDLSEKAKGNYPEYNMQDIIFHVNVVPKSRKDGQIFGVAYVFIYDRFHRNEFYNVLVGKTPSGEIQTEMKFNTEKPRLNVEQIREWWLFYKDTSIEKEKLSYKIFEFGQKFFPDGKFKPGSHIQDAFEEYQEIIKENLIKTGITEEDAEERVQTDYEFNGDNFVKIAKEVKENAEEISTCNDFKLEPAYISTKNDVAQHHLIIEYVDENIVETQIYDIFKIYNTLPDFYTDTYQHLDKKKQTVISSKPYPHVFKEKSKNKQGNTWHVIYSSAVNNNDGAFAIIMSRKIKISFTNSLKRTISKEYIVNPLRLKSREYIASGPPKIMQKNNFVRSTNRVVRVEAKKVQEKTQTTVTQSVWNKPVIDSKSLPPGSAWSNPIPDTLFMTDQTTLEQTEFVGSEKVTGVSKRGYISTYPDGTPLKDDGNSSIMF